MGRFLAVAVAALLSVGVLVATGDSADRAAASGAATISVLVGKQSQSGSAVTTYTTEGGGRCEPSVINSCRIELVYDAARAIVTLPRGNAELDFNCEWEGGIAFALHEPIPVRNGQVSYRGPYQKNGSDEPYTPGELLIDGQFNPNGTITGQFSIDGTMADEDYCSQPGYQKQTYSYIAVPSAEGGGAESPLADPVRLYAPLLHVDPRDDYFPMDPDEFVRHSRLTWAHDAGCADHKNISAGRLKTKRKIRKLASGGYKHQRAKRLYCAHSGRSYSSRKPTAPAQRKEKWHVPRGQGEGFYLDLDNRERHGEKPRAGTDMPMYYTYKPRRYITYWAFYGYNSRVGDKHEGDWEKIVVRLNDDNVATAVAYYQHFCDPSNADTKYGIFTWEQMTRRGYLADGTHPQLYSALGGHGSFPGPVGSVKFPCGENHKRDGFGDRVKGGGPTWRTWEGTLRSTRNAAWYGYGGGWGERPRVANPFGWGPLGPSPSMMKHVEPAPSGWR